MKPREQSTPQQKSVTEVVLLRLLPLFLVMVGVLATYYVSKTSSSRLVMEQAELRKIELQENYVLGDLQSVISDLRYFTALPHIRNLMISTGPDLQRYREMAQTEFLHFAAQKGVYDQLRILDISGKERIRVNYRDGNPQVVPEEELQEKAHRYYVRETYDRTPGDIYLSPLDLNMESGQVETPLKPMIRFGSVLVSDQGEITGALIFNYLGRNLLERFGRYSRTSAGISFLLNQDGYYLYAEDPNITWGFMFPDEEIADKTLAKNYPGAWQHISDHSQGQFLNKKGLFTYTSVYPNQIAQVNQAAPGHHREDTYVWKLVSFVPDQDVFAEARELKVVLFSTGGILFLLFLLGSIRISLTKQAQSKAEERIRRLQGIIPICMHCKKIRDDEGSWNQLERYITEHSEAHFSHGLCETCMKELYDVPPPDTDSGS